MTQAVSRSQVSTFVAQTSPFDRLSPGALKNLTDQCDLFRYRMGQPILERSKMPAQISILYQGQARVLGHDQRNQRAVSLQIAGPGTLLGWAGLIRGVACETAIASTEAVCISMPVNAFRECLNANPEFAQALRDRVSLEEVFELLSLELQRRADGSSNLKELAFQLWPEATVRHFLPGRADLSRLERDRFWLVSYGNVADNPQGSSLDLDSLPDTANIKDPKGLRLIGLPRAAAEPGGQLSTPHEIHEDGGGQLAETEDADIPYAPARPPEPPPDPLAPPPRYPHVRGRGPVGSALACFQMLSQHLRLPFRKDAIRKVLDNQLKTKGEISLYACGAVAQMMGVSGQLAKVPGKAIGRLSAPAMIKWQDSFALLYSINEREIVMAVPEVGILDKSPQELAEESPDTIQVLLLQPPAGDTGEKFSIWWFLPSLKKYRKVLIEVFIASFFVQLFGLANPLLTQVIIDKVLGQRSIETLDVLGVLMIGIALFEALLTSLRTYLFVDTTNRIDLSLGSEVIDHLFRLPLKYFDQRRVGDIAYRVNELSRIRQFLTGTALTVVLDAIFSVIYIAVMLSYSLVLTAVALVTVPLFAVLIVFVSPIVRRLLRKRAERYADAQSFLVENLSGMQTVKAQNIELKSRWKWYERYARFMNAGFRTTLTNTAASSIAQFLNKLSGLLLLWVGAHMVLDGQLSLGQLIAFRIISSKVTGSLLKFVQVWQSFQEVSMSIERLRDILNAAPEADESDRENIPMPDVNGDVKFEEVSFRFGTTGPMQVANVNLEFSAGTFVGIVGQSGSGKSTMMKLLQRLYNPVSGRIKLDGYDISKVELYSLRRQVGVVLQDTLLFNGTVKDNIALTNPDASDDEIIEAAKVAVAHEFIMGLPNGYNTVVGERGSSLSGGQRQRIAIARTVLQGPRLLILDEATSALDYNSERLACQNLIEWFKDRTVFFITHRLSTVKSADVILMMDDGAVVEQGSHDELMQLKGRYYCLYQQQEAQL